MRRLVSERRWIRPCLGTLQAFIGLGGVAGGIGLVADPSGGNVGMTTESLAGSPFASYLVPGLVLLGVNGIGSLAGAFLTYFNRRFAAEAAAGLGAFLMAWILVQVSVIGLVHWLQPLYFALGFLELVLGLSLRTKLQRPESS